MAAEPAPSAAPTRRSRQALTRRTLTGTDAGAAPGFAGADWAHPVMSAELLSSARSLYDAYLTPGAGTLALPELRQALKDMGYEYTANQVKDLVLQVSQSAGIQKRNEQAARAAAQRAIGDCLSPSVLSTMPDTALLSMGMMSGATAAGGGGAAKTVDFLTFCEVLALNLSDADTEGELRRAWDVLDADGDGVLGAGDLASALGTLGLGSLTPEELLLALEQADYDCDGRVKFNDFVRTMDST